MAHLDLRKRTFNAKLVYYGPGLCGKTTNLEYVNKHFAKDQQLMSLSTQGDRTIFFDFMPLDLGTLRGMAVQFKLYTVPGQVRYNQTRKMVLKNVDGVVFVADSQREMFDSNLESFENLFDNLKELHIKPEDVNIILQYNKRDLPNAAPLSELEKSLNQHGYPSFLASAYTGEGVLTTLRAACRHVLDRLTVDIPESDPKGSKAAAAVPASQQSAKPAPGAGKPPAKEAPKPDAKNEVKKTAAESPARTVSGATEKSSPDRKPRSETQPQFRVEPTPEPPEAAPTAAGSSAALEAVLVKCEAMTGTMAKLLSQSETTAKALSREVETLRMDSWRKDNESSKQKAKAESPGLTKEALDELGKRLPTREGLSALEKRIRDLEAAQEKRIAELEESQKKQLGDLEEVQKKRAAEIVAALVKMGDLPARADVEAIKSRLADLPGKSDFEALSKEWSKLSSSAPKSEAGAAGARPAAGSKPPSDEAGQERFADMLVAKLSSVGLARHQAMLKSLSELPSKGDIETLAAQIGDLKKALEAQSADAKAQSAEFRKLHDKISALPGQSTLSVLGDRLTHMSRHFTDDHQKLLSTVSEHASSNDKTAKALEALEKRMAELPTREDLKALERSVAVASEMSPPSSGKGTTVPMWRQEPEAKAEPEKPKAEAKPEEKAEPEKAEAKSEPEKEAEAEKPEAEKAEAKAEVEKEAEPEKEAEAEKAEAEPEPEKSEEKAEPEKSEEKAEPEKSEEKAEPDDDKYADDPAHKNAARVARVMVSDLYLYQKEQFEEGIRNGDFEDRNKEALEDMRTTYESRVPAEVRDQKDHLAQAIRDMIEKKRKRLNL